MAVDRVIWLIFVLIFSIAYANIVPNEEIGKNSIEIKRLKTEMQSVLQTIQKVETGTNDGILELKGTVANMNQRLSTVVELALIQELRIQNVEKIMNNLLKLSKKEDCTEVKSFDVDDGNYYIGKENMFEAKCFKEDENTTTTIVETDHQNFQEFDECIDGFGCAEEVEVNYQATDEELKNLVQASETCKQDFSFKCKNTPFVIVPPIRKTWWTDIHGIKQQFLHGNNASNHYSCQFIGCKCNLPGTSEDQGTITLKSALPIKKFHYGPLDSMEGQTASVKVGPLRCSGYSEITVADCVEVLERNMPLTQFYHLESVSASYDIPKVQCLEEGWLVIQSRGPFGNPRDFFFTRNWEDYAKGFGKSGEEFWIGLRNMNKLTNIAGRPMELKVTLENKSGEKAYALYKNFRIGTEAEKFKLHIGTYSGTAGDSLTHNKNMKFSTPDQDNDTGSGRNCAAEYMGAWWYKSCHDTHLNGLNYGPSETVKSSAGIVWGRFGGHSISLKSVQMAIRPMN